ncbi:MAG: methionine adenosyltransferase [Oscillospiraceae bacterium]|jgi:S-adenosylmethionine synthetase|nr:methionine adenosyltransferase [Oscillospiraceae bacterium]
MKNSLFTSESVTEGHPDKVCDQISDAVLDEILANDPNGRVACEAVVTTGTAFIMGEISTSKYVDIPKIVRKTLKEIGYDGGACGLSFETCGVLTAINEQSGDIACGVDCAFDSPDGADEVPCIGAGDQGMMFGFACRETPELMPLPISLAHAVARRLAKTRNEGILPYLKPDGKTQITVAYEDSLPVSVDAVVVAAQHDEYVDYEQLKLDVLEKVIKVAIPGNLLSEQTKFYINPTGRFVVGGPQADSGLTGRKIMVDTYGGYSRHGGGAFSGKDPTKVDRSASYMARYVAKNVVASGLAERCEIQVAYAIGGAEPVSLMVNTFGTGRLADLQVAEIVREIFDFRPAAIINTLDLRKPIYRRLAAYGHFGREDLGVVWERLDKAQDIKDLALARFGFAS